MRTAGGFRSNWGADLFAAVRSVVGTAARHGSDAYQAIHAILTGASVFQAG
jgi:transposase